MQPGRGRPFDSIKTYENSASSGGRFGSLFATSSFICSLLSCIKKSMCDWCSTFSMRCVETSFLDDAVGSRQKFARRFAEGIGKLVGNAKGDHWKEDRRTYRKIAEVCVS
ncbi:hypothetical protein GW17_00034329 [Ensete ventricosum]|nr:hypothetical protein GW17_00034329 [Ensete ventricosum]